MNIELINKISLKTKIITAATIIIIATTTISSIFFYTKIKTILFQNLQQRGKTICENLARSAKYRILTEDTEILNELAKGTMLSDDVVFVIITNENGRNLAEKSIIKIPETSGLCEQALKKGCGQFQAVQSLSGPDVYIFCQPVVAQKVNIAEQIGAESEQETDRSPQLKGMVQIGLSTQNTVTKLANMLWGIILLTIAVICVGIFFSVGFVKLIMKPIVHMAQAASKVAAGDLSQTVKIESSDEIGQFAEQFNIMTTALKDRQEQLNESYHELAASEERYRAFIQNSSECIWCFESKNRKGYSLNGSEDEIINQMLNNSVITEYNDAAAKMYGISKNKRPDESEISEFLSPQNTETLLNLSNFIRQDYRLSDMQTELNVSGSKRILMSNLVGIKINNQLNRIWVIQRDVTEVKAAERKQTELFEQIKHVNQELTDFAYVASHDLKAPLRGIKTLSEWLSFDYASKLDDKGQEQLRLLCSRVDRMHNLIDGILQYSRIGRVHEKPVPIDLNTFLPDVIDMIAPPENIKIIPEKQLPIITYEETRIRQVFQNLLSNAVKYMDKAEGIISVGFEDADEFWKFHVTDNGPGIDSKYHEKIFKMFQTLVKNDEYDSTGIGLTLVKKIVELYGGNVWVESQPGKGSSFYFTIFKEPCRIAAKYVNIKNSRSIINEEPNIVRINNLKEKIVN